MKALAIGAALLIAAAGMPVRAGGEKAPDPQAQRILDEIARTDSRRSADDRRAARELNADGDRDYRKGRYHKAFMSYANSYPNYPNPYAYILSGDSHWRSVAGVQAASAPASTASDAASCRLDNKHFASDLRGDVVQHFQVGLALAAARKDTKFMATPLYRRAGAIEACLSAMADEYAAKPPSSCVDMAKLKSCLGEPLIK